MQVWSTWDDSFRMGFGLNGDSGNRLQLAIPLTEIALSYKKNLYRKVNSSKSALAFSVTIQFGCLPLVVGGAGIGQAQPTVFGGKQLLQQCIQMRLLDRENRPLHFG